ncbi:uncharacterized protein LOC131613052 [Vicia villosa]|uniref:uncharacterized protein LOC131613052 n=1 Tax=Vicia villosa TaxID=3911 RepID=UPI00273A832F|nr:uncharacterized protein LOC131613052 [Vicia villosa]
MADSSNHGKDQSSSSEHQPSSNTDTSSPPAPPPVAAPHMMYYQPGPGGYPHGPPPPPFHPYPPPPHGYPPYPPQPQGYNNYPGHAPYYPPHQNYHSDVGSRSFLRGFIMCSCFIFTGFFVSTIIMAFMLHPQLPVYKVSAMSVENFNTSSVLTGDWSISLTVQNPNTKLNGLFSDFKVDVVHGTNEIAMSFVPDFQLEKHEQKQMDVKASSNNGGNVVSFQKWDLDKMSNEKLSGSIKFGLRVSSMTEFKSTSMTTRSMIMMFICDSLKIVFQNNTGTGTLENGGIPVECKIYT